MKITGIIGDVELKITKQKLGFFSLQGLGSQHHIHMVIQNVKLKFYLHYLILF